MEEGFPVGPAAEAPPVEVGPAQPQKHPIAVFFHLFFKIAAIVVYLCLKWFYSHFILAFIIVVLILAADFWTVKNVSGRLLVGLRWWHYVKEDGTNVWMFESSKHKVNTAEAVIFWTSLIGAVPLWILLAIVALLNLDIKWLFLIAVAVVLSGANIMGYTKCLKDKKGKISRMATTMATDYLVNRATSG